MSKQVKDLITREFQARLKDIDGVAVINPRGINAIKNNLIRRRLHEKGLRMMVVKNTLARRATDGTALKGFEKLLDGPSAVVYGKQSLPTIARAVLDEKKADETLELRGVFFDGEVYEGDRRAAGRFLIELKAAAASRGVEVSGFLPDAERVRIEVRER